MQRSYMTMRLKPAATITVFSSTNPMMRREIRRKKEEPVAKEYNLVQPAVLEVFRHLHRSVVPSPRTQTFSAHV